VRQSIQARSNPSASASAAQIAVAAAESLARTAAAIAETDQPLARSPTGRRQPAVGEMLCASFRGETFACVSLPRWIRSRAQRRIGGKITRDEIRERVERLGQYATLAQH
jgi:hypothetical protein